MFTPGPGNARGAVTLCPFDSVFTNVIQLEDRGNVFMLKLPNGSNDMVITNLYAPTTRGPEKSTF